MMTDFTDNFASVTGGFRLSSCGGALLAVGLVIAAPFACGGAEETEMSLVTPEVQTGFARSVVA